MIHPLKISLNNKCFLSITIKQAPKTAEFIMRHCAWWESGGWVIKESIGSFLLVTFCFRLSASENMRHLFGAFTKNIEMPKRT